MRKIVIIGAPEGIGARMRAESSGLRAEIIIIDDIKDVGKDTAVLACGSGVTEESLIKCIEDVFPIEQIELVSKRKASERVSDCCSAKVLEVKNLNGDVVELVCSKCYKYLYL